MIELLVTFGCSKRKMAVIIRSERDNWVENVDVDKIVICSKYEEIRNWTVTGKTLFKLTRLQVATNLLKSH